MGHGYFTFLVPKPKTPSTGDFAFLLVDYYSIKTGDANQMQPRLLQISAGSSYWWLLIVF